MGHFLYFFWNEETFIKPSDLDSNPNIIPEFPTDHFFDARAHAKIRFWEGGGYASWITSFNSRLFFYIYAGILYSRLESWQRFTYQLIDSPENPTSFYQQSLVAQGLGMQVGLKVALKLIGACFAKAKVRFAPIVGRRSYFYLFRSPDDTAINRINGIEKWAVMPETSVTLSISHTLCSEQGRVELEGGFEWVFFADLFTRHLIDGGLLVQLSPIAFSGPCATLKWSF